MISNKIQGIENVRSILFKQGPASMLMLKTVRRNKKIITINILSTLLEPALEAATLAILFIIFSLLDSNGVARPLIAESNFANIDYWVQMHPNHALVVCIVLLVLFQFFISITRYISSLSLGYFIAETRSLVTMSIYKKIFNQSFESSSLYKIGDLSDHILEGCEGVRIQVERVNEIFVGFLMASTYFVVLAYVSRDMLVGALGIGLISIIVQRYMRPRLAEGSQQVTSARLRTNIRLTENFQALKYLHSNGLVEFSVSKVQNLVSQLSIAYKNQYKLLCAVTPISSFLPIIGLAIIAFISINIYSKSGSAVLASLLTFMVGLQRFNSRINSMSSSFSLLIDNTARIDRLNQILSNHPSRIKPAGGTHKTYGKYNISLRNVFLKYKDQHDFALKDISIEIPSGKTIALVGHSGSGKSSIVDLISGLYYPTKGTIYIDNESIANIDLDFWKQNIGIVSQDVFLFNATIRENLVWGLKNYQDTDIISCAEIANCHNFIKNLPQGYNTILGERGTRLSGGQRQRLSLARVLMKNPCFIILDEATSALDSQSEALIQESLANLKGNRTFLIVAHRLSTIIEADLIYVLNHGRIVEQGTHSSLLANASNYYDLWSAQNASKSTFNDL